MKEQIFSTFRNQGEHYTIYFVAFYASRRAQGVFGALFPWSDGCSFQLYCSPYQQCHLNMSSLRPVSVWRIRPLQNTYEKNAKTSCFNSQRGVAELIRVENVTSKLYLPFRLARVSSRPFRKKIYQKSRCPVSRQSVHFHTPTNLKSISRCADQGRSHQKILPNKQESHVEQFSKP